MKAERLIKELQNRNISLSTDGKRIHYKAPKGVMNEKILSAIKEHKQELIDALNHHQRNTPIKRKAQQSKN